MRSLFKALIALPSTLLLAATLMASSAQATVIYKDFSSLGKKATPDSITWNFASPTGWASLNFQLAGYLSLDGYNNRGYSDIFHLILNGTEIFTGSFNMGGGGTNKVIYNPNGGVAITNTFGATDDVHNSKQTTWNGGTTDIVLPVELLGTANQLIFKYTGWLQGARDEAWGINVAALNFAPVALAEPSTTLLLLLGLGGIWMLRRRNA